MPTVGDVALFTFAATPVKFVALLVLFAFTLAWSVNELTRPQDARQRVSNVLHLVMAAVMVVMVPGLLWTPFVAAVPLPALVAVFGLATAWFVSLAVGARTAARGVRWHYSGHALMFAAMTWHLAAMAAMHGLMTASPGGMPGMNHGGGMGGMPVGSMAEARAAASAPGGVLWIFALVGLPLMAYLLVAGVSDVGRSLRARVAPSVCHCGADCACGGECACPAHVPASDEVLAQALGAGAASGSVRVRSEIAASCHEARPVGSPKYRLSALADASMNLGMFWMSTGLLLPILPMLAALAF